MTLLKKFISLIISLVILNLLFVPACANEDTVNISEFIKPNTGVDAVDIIQSVIDNNPNRTIAFPDGEYLVSKPIVTSANPNKSVSLKMTDFTVIKAIGYWKSGEAVIQLGGKDPANTTHYSGSNYSLDSGVIDGNGVANGVSINSGRETAIRNTSIKNAVIGLHIMYGANSGSSDSDITGVNIIGTGKTNSVGVLVEGYDNTITNMRIGYVYTGVILRSSGNVLRNIHPLYYSDGTDYENSCGFVLEGGNNWLDFCYSDQFAIGYRFVDGNRSILNDCFCMWYCNAGDETAFLAEDEFNSVVTNFKIGFQGEAYRTVLKIGKTNGDGSISNLDASTRRNDNVYKGYLTCENIFQQIARLFYKFISLFYLI